MGIATPSFTMGIEEEYLLVDRDSLALTEAPAGLMEACTAALADQVSPEFLQCQIEVGTRVCQDIGAAREDLRRLRACVVEEAARFNLAPIGVSCHPFAEWSQMHHTEGDRYNALQRDLGGVARRMLICGMHVHVAIEDDDLRADLLPQASYFLPHLLAFSASSPFWRGADTGLASYRMTVFDNLPRTGLPPDLSSWAEYERATGVLIDLGIIEDTTKIWWDLRPSHKFPTLETRICDVQPRLEHALSLAAVTQATMRMLWRLRTRNLRWRAYDRFLIAENRWRALRYGTSEGLIDFGRGEIVSCADLCDEWIEELAEDGEVLGSTHEIEALADILKGGTSSDRQRRVYQGSLDAGADEDEALRAVVEHLIVEFQADL